MAIQIDEKLLSNEAKEFLRNAKSKSQLLRDALEFYIRNIKEGEGSTGVSNLDKDVINDIKDIKKMILEISANGYKPISENESFIDIKESIISKEIDEKPDIKKEVEKEVIYSEANETEKEIKSDDSMTEERRLLEKMLDESLDNF